MALSMIADPNVIGPTVSSNTKSLLISIKRKEKSLEKLLATYRRNSKGASDLRRQKEEGELKLPIMDREPVQAEPPLAVLIGHISGISTSGMLEMCGRLMG